MRTSGRLMLSCEVTPEIYEQVSMYARSQGVSMAQVMRNMLDLYFLNKPIEMARSGTALYKEKRVSEEHGE